MKEVYTLGNMSENNVYGRFASFFKNYELKKAVQIKKEVDEFVKKLKEQEQ